MCLPIQPSRGNRNKLAKLTLLIDKRGLIDPVGRGQKPENEVQFAAAEHAGDAVLLSRAHRRKTCARRSTTSNCDITVLGRADVGTALFDWAPTSSALR
jgi:hypothetical protein